MRPRAARIGGAALLPNAGAAASRRRVVVLALAFSWLNLHVWLDTVALMGALLVQYAPDNRAFGGGAIPASAVFFTALGHGAVILRPVLARQRAWALFEALIGLVMWVIAASLALRALAG